MESPSSTMNRQHVDDDYDTIRRETPNLLDWMCQAVREHVALENGDEIKPENLKLWSFGRRENGVGLGVALSGQQKSVNPLLREHGLRWLLTKKWS
jgi:hypothetical protein